MILGLGSSMSLLTVSGWFLAATAIAGLGTLFNFFYPFSQCARFSYRTNRHALFWKNSDAWCNIPHFVEITRTSIWKIIPLSPAVLNRYRNSDLLNRLVSDVDTLDSLYLRFICAIFSLLYL